MALATFSEYLLDFERNVAKADITIQAASPWLKPRAIVVKKLISKNKKYELGENLGTYGILYQK